MLFTLSDADQVAIGLSVRLASTVTLILLLLLIPLAWWLAQTTWRGKALIVAVSGLPMLLPPTVLGFYLLELLGPRGLIGTWSQRLGLDPLPFSFSGLVLASVLYSLPFVLQPLLSAFEAVPVALLEAAATLGAGPCSRFFKVALPLSRSGILSAVLLVFTHTLGEFGVVLMLGGNIPGRTQVLSIQIYNHVENFEYPQAQQLALGLLLFSFLALVCIQFLQYRTLRRG